MRKSWIVVLTAVFLISCVLPAAAGSIAPPANLPVQGGVKFYPKHKLSDVNTYTVYYGEGKIGEMKKFDLAILETASQTKAGIAELTKAGTTTIGYISVGEADPDTWYYPFVDPKWALGTNENWNSKYIDVRNQGWHDLILKKMIPHIVDYGVQGLFLDTVDSVDVEPKMKDAMVQLIREIREMYPDLILVMNRGLTIMDEAVPYVDSIMFESFSVDVDWDTVNWDTNPPKAIYRKWGNEEQLWTSDTARRLGEWQMKTGLTVLSLDYANPGDTELIQYAYDRATAFGSGLWNFVPYVSTLDLQHIYHHPQKFKRHDRFRDSDGDGVTDEEEKTASLDPKNRTTKGTGISDLFVYKALQVRKWADAALKPEGNETARQKLKQVLSLMDQLVVKPDREQVISAQAAMLAYKQASTGNPASLTASQQLDDLLWLF